MKWHISAPIVGVGVYVNNAEVPASLGVAFL